VRDEHERVAELGPHELELLLQDLAHLRIERAERLVREEDLGPAGERPRERGSMAHAPRELVRLDVGERREAHLREPAGGRLPDLVGSETLQPERVLDVLSHAEPGEERRVLEQQRTIGSGLEDRATIQRNLAGIGPLETGEQVQDRRLAAAGGPDQADELARADVEGDVVEHGHLGARPRRERLPHPAERELDGRGSGSGTIERAREVVIAT
jgi:hypothetical protein